MPLNDLVKELRAQGVDIFPEDDSHCYIEGELAWNNKNVCSVPDEDFTLNINIDSYFQF